MPGKRLAGDAGVEDLGVEVGAVRPFHATEFSIDADFGEELGIVEGLEDALEGDEVTDIDFPGLAVVEAQGEFVRVEGAGGGDVAQYAR